MMLASLKQTKKFQSQAIETTVIRITSLIHNLYFFFGIVTKILSYAFCVYQSRKNHSTVLKHN